MSKRKPTEQVTQHNYERLMGPDNDDDDGGAGNDATNSGGATMPPPPAAAPTSGPIRRRKVVARRSGLVNRNDFVAAPPPPSSSNPFANLQPKPTAAGGGSTSFGTFTLAAQDKPTESKDDKEDDDVVGEESVGTKFGLLNYAFEKAFTRAVDGLLLTDCSSLMEEYICQARQLRLLNQDDADLKLVNNCAGKAENEVPIVRNYMVEGCKAGRRMPRTLQQSDESSSIDTGERHLSYSQMIRQGLADTLGTSASEKKNDAMGPVDSSSVISGGTPGNSLPSFCLPPSAGLFHRAQKGPVSGSAPSPFQSVVKGSTAPMESSLNANLTANFAPMATSTPIVEVDAPPKKTTAMPFPSFSFMSKSSSSSEQPFNFLSPTTTSAPAWPPAAAAADASAAEEEVPYEPPKVEQVDVGEEDARHSVKCKVFYLDAGEMKTKGVGMAHIKELANKQKCQLLVRASTQLGTVLLNVQLNASENCVAVKDDPKFSAVQFTAPANPPIDEANPTRPYCFTLKVKNNENRDELIRIIKELTSDDAESDATSI